MLAVLKIILYLHINQIKTVIFKLAINIGDIEDKNDVTHTICVNNEETKTVGKLELLSVIWKLNITNHISSICKKVSQTIGPLMRLRNLIPISAKLVLFKTAILP